MITRADLRGSRDIVWHPPVFTRLNRCSDIVAHRAVSAEILGQDRFFDPSQIKLFFQTRNPPDSFGHRKRLVVIHHDLHVIADNLT